MKKTRAIFTAIAIMAGAVSSASCCNGGGQSGKQCNSRTESREKGQDGKTADLFVGTYGSHLYRYAFDTESGMFTVQGKVEAVNPSYVSAVSKGKDGILIYAVSENGTGSGVYSFSDNGEKGPVMTAELHQTGASPCFIAMLDSPDKAEDLLLTADYTGGSISVFPIKEGRLDSLCQQLKFKGSGPVEKRQKSSHIHQIRELPATCPAVHRQRKGDPKAQRYILATDLGADVIRLLKVHTGPLEHIADIPCPAGSGPRHMEFSKNGMTLYCIAELNGEVLVYDIAYDNGIPTFSLKQRILADEVNAGGSADIHLHPSGKWLYTSHRLDNDGIAIFKTRKDGTIEKIGYVRTARHPRNFMITEDGKNLIVACRDDKLVQVFSIGKDGMLTLTPSVIQFENDMPSSVKAVTGIL